MNIEIKPLKPKNILILSLLWTLFVGLFVVISKMKVETTIAKYMEEITVTQLTVEFGIVLFVWFIFLLIFLAITDWDY